MTKYEFYLNELRKIGVVNADGEQYLNYFKQLSSSYVLCKLSGRVMAYIAVKMAEQKRYGANELFEELSN